MTQIIEDIIALEWDMTNRTDLINRLRPCMYDKDLFITNRKRLLATWNEDLQKSYYQDLCMAQKEGRNPVNEKYGYMLEQTNPEEYDRIKDQLPECSLEKLFLIDWISQHLVEWQEGLAQKYPRLVGNKNMIRRNQDNQQQKTFEAHIRSELATFSEETLRTYAAYIEQLQKSGLNLNQMIFENVVAPYGCQTLEEAEQFLIEHGQ